MKKKIKKIILAIEYTCSDYEVIDHVAKHKGIGKIREVKTLKV